MSFSADKLGNRQLIPDDVLKRLSDIGIAARFALLIDATGKIHLFYARDQTVVRQDLRSPAGTTLTAEPVQTTPGDNEILELIYADADVGWCTKIGGVPVWF